MPEYDQTINSGTCPSMTKQPGSVLGYIPEYDQNNQVWYPVTQSIYHGRGYTSGGTRGICPSMTKTSTFALRRVLCIFSSTSTPDFEKKNGRFTSAHRTYCSNNIVKQKWDQRCWVGCNDIRISAAVLQWLRTLPRQTGIL